MLGIKGAPTQEMIEGKQEHQSLYDQFEKEAVPATLEEMLLESKAVTVSVVSYASEIGNMGFTG